MSFADVTARISQIQAQFEIGPVAQPTPAASSGTSFADQLAAVSDPPPTDTGSASGDAVVADARSAWARRRKLGLAELIDEPWILSHVEVRPGSPVMQAFEDQGIGLPKNLILSGSLNLRYSLLATGRYLTVMPSTVLKFCPGRGAVKALPVELPRWPIPTVVATLRHRALSPVAKLFIERARELSAGL